MKWFKPKYAVCRECGVHYEPVTGYEARWGHLCFLHRKPVMERDLRKEAVVSWASSNWERLEDMYKKENEAARAAFSSVQQAGLEQMAKRQQSATQAGYGVLGELGRWNM